MNAPMPMGGMPQPGMVPAPPTGAGMPPEQPMPGGTPPGGGYPSGAEIMGQQQPPGEVENPVLAGFRTVVQLVGTLAERGDPRAEPAKMALQQLLQALSGGDLPMQPPFSEPGMGPEMGPPPGMGPEMGPPPGMGPETGPPPGMGPEPMPEMVGDPFAAPAPVAGPSVKPMGPKAPQKAGQKQPTILT